MAAVYRKNIRRLLSALLTCAAAFSFENGVVTVAFAQTATEALAPKISEDAKLMLSANELVYDRDSQRVTAIGGVQINYDGYQMVAQRVEYNQKTGRMMAVGNIELIEPNGNKLYGETLDVTDNFANGFLNALRIETTDNTRLAAESGERVDGNLMILNNGVYTACLPCAQRPDGAPLWQIKAERVVQNGTTHTVRLENAKFELFGYSIASIPVLEVPDQTVKRKSGFLFPRMTTSQNLGFGLTVPYYYVISNSMDVTVSATGYTSQGFLLDTEFRQRLDNGIHVLRVAGISQSNPDTFTPGTSDADVDGRGMIQSKGDFKINPRWAFGWDAMLQSDNNFSRTYELNGIDEDVHTNQAYLTGLGKRNAFDLRAFYFDIQDADKDSKAEKQQAKVMPVLDYNYIAPEAVAGGELSVDVNFTNISRDRTDVSAIGLYDKFPGLPGRSSRLSTEAEWKRTFITPFGLTLTPLLAARGDALNLDVTAPNSVFSGGYSYNGNFTDDSNVTRGMVTAGLEARYPILITTENSSHIFEPIAQVFLRNDEEYAGGLPNEDAQSFVFDATTLFERDKFSGYDRVEGGSRANLGMRYTGSFDNGYRLRSVVGQSFHLGGVNSFATDDLVYAGADSGLETDASDYVGMAAIDTPYGMSLATNLRLDEEDLSFRRSGTTLSFTNKRLSTALTYTQIAAQPIYGSPSDRSELQSEAAVKLNANWSVLGSVTWDLDNNVLSRRTLGFAYGDECTIFSIVYEDNADVSNEQASDWSIGAKLTFRTLGDINIGGN